MNEDMQKFWEQLKTERDLLIVRAHLASAELKDEWAALEEKWHEAEQKLRHLQDNAFEATQEMKLSANIIMEEIANAYKRIKERLDD